MWSGGKDSTANVALAHINDEPHGKIIMSEVMFDKNISGELPEHMEWVHTKAIPLFKSWGFEVEILHSDVTYMDCFNRINQGKRNPERKGKRYGFPMSGKCLINTDCKMKPIRNYLSSIKEDYIQYVGIAIDEPARLDKMRKNPTKKSLLEKYGYTERMAYDLVKQYNLLSPMYDYSKRGGCWFCPNAGDCQLKNVRTNHNDLWQKLLDLEMQSYRDRNTVGNIWNTLTGTSIHQKELQFKYEDAQLTIFDFIR